MPDKFKKQKVSNIHKPTEEIQQKNELIALFMGATYKKDDYGDMGYFFPIPVFQEWHTAFQRTALSFHKSWNWLIPVVERIEHEFNHGVSITEEQCEIWDKYDQDIIVSEMAGTKIEATYNAVLSFIKSKYNTAND